MAEHHRDAAFSSAINESMAWTSVLRPLKKKVAPSEPAAANCANAVKHPQRQASDDFHPDGTRFLKCRFFMMGTCAKGAKCHFMHWEPAAAPRKPHVHASSSSSSTPVVQQSSSSSAKAAVGPVASNPISASASACASIPTSSSASHSTVSMSSSIAPLDSKACTATAAIESAYSDDDESDDHIRSAGRAPLPARAPRFDGDSEGDSELYFYGAPGAQPVPAPPVVRIDANNPTAAVSFAKMAARNIVHAPAMASQFAAVVTASTSRDGRVLSSNISPPSLLFSPTVADPLRKPCVYFAQGFCRFGRVCILNCALQRLSVFFRARFHSF
jgi:hypothetical protein